MPVPLTQTHLPSTCPALSMCALALHPQPSSASGCPSHNRGAGWLVSYPWDLSPTTEHSSCLLTKRRQVHGLHAGSIWAQVAPSLFPTVRGTQTLAMPP